MRNSPKKNILHSIYFCRFHCVQYSNQECKISFSVVYKGLKFCLGSSIFLFIKKSSVERLIWKEKKKIIYTCFFRVWMMHIVYYSLNYYLLLTKWDENKSIKIFIRIAYTLKTLTWTLFTNLTSYALRFFNLAEDSLYLKLRQNLRFQIHTFIFDESLTVTLQLLTFFLIISWLIAKHGHKYC